MCFRFRLIRQAGIFRRICALTLIISQPEEEGTAFQSVDYNAVSPLLVILLIGVGISVVILIVERMNEPLRSVNTLHRRRLDNTHRTQHN